MDDTITIRQPLESPARTVREFGVNDRKSKVVFKHPGYPDSFGQNVLFTMYAWDGARGGLHAGTALLACGLLACNKWDGYLTVGRDGEKIVVQNDTLLRGKEYYFHVPLTTSDQASSGSSNHEAYRYPVYPSFQHWAFPHENLPMHWFEEEEELGDREANEDNQDTFDSNQASTAAPSTSAITGAVIRRDRRCTISKSSDYIERAHLCPRSEIEWFQNNSMHQYNDKRELSGDFQTDDMSNAIALRPDIHRAFDDGKFVIARKKGQWVAHFLELTLEMGKLYHNRPIEINHGVSPKFLLVRFAWAIFPMMRQFMENGVDRRVKVRERTSYGVQEAMKTMSRMELWPMSDAKRSRSASPRKRKAFETGGDLPDIKKAKRLRRTYDNLRGCDDDDSSEVSDLRELGDGLQFPSLTQEETPSAQDFHLQQSYFEDSSSPTIKPAISTPPATVSSVQPATATDKDPTGISSLRHQALRSQRPTNPLLICCDYTLAERANALGIPGKSEYGGGHLCMECLGAEVEVDEFAEENESHRLG